MASPTLPPFMLSPGVQTKQNQWKGSHGNADCWIAGSAPCGTKQSRGKAGSGSKSKEASDWHDPLRQAFQIPNLQMGIFKKTLKPKLVVLQISYQFLTPGLGVCQNSPKRETQLSAGPSPLRVLQESQFASFPCPTRGFQTSFFTHSDDHCLYRIQGSKRRKTALRVEKRMKGWKQGLGVGEEEKTLTQESA